MLRRVTMSSPQSSAALRSRPATVKELRATQLFNEVSDRIIRQLVQGKHARISILQPRMPLTLRKGRVEYIYIVLKGYLEVRLNSSLIKKGKSFLLAFRGPDQIVGEMSAIAREP